MSSTDDDSGRRHVYVLSRPSSWRAVHGPGTQLSWQADLVACTAPHGVAARKPGYAAIAVVATDASCCHQHAGVYAVLERSGSEGAD